MIGELCRRCQILIAIPGLDASLCPQCGWVENRTVQEQVEVAPKPKPKHTRKKNAA